MAIVLRALVLVMATLAAPRAAGAGPATWNALLGKSHLVVHVFKKGLLSGMAHDHHFVPADWRATARFDPARPADARFEVVVAAASLRDRQASLSTGDREKVERQTAGPDVLDAQRYPEISFVSTGQVRGAAPPEGRIDGELPGTLSLHGRQRGLSVPVHATREGDGWRARGSVRFKQSDFGIRPYSGFLGTIAVEDEVELEYDLVLSAVP
jgi:polyisoprenoid-binding protein YceI